MSKNSQGKKSRAPEKDAGLEGQTIAAETGDRDARKHALTAFVRDHPLLMLAGGITAGLIVGSLVPRRTGRAIVRRTSALTEIAAAAAMSFGKDAADRAGDAGEQIRKGSHVIADRAEDWTALALKSASVFAQTAAESVAKLGAVAAEKAEELGETAADRVQHTGRQASRRIDKAVPVAEAAAAHAGKRLGSAIADLRTRLLS